MKKHDQFQFYNADDMCHTLIICEMTTISSGVLYTASVLWCQSELNFIASR